MIALLVANLVISSLLLLLFTAVVIAGAVVSRRKKRALAQLVNSKAGADLAALLKNRASNESAMG